MDNTVEMQYDKLAAALAKVQAQIKPAKMGSENPFFKSKYANLAEITDACRKALTDNGFAVVQHGSWHDGHQFLRTTLLHSSGQSISGEYLVKPGKDDCQGLMAAWTYARRGSLAAICGVVTEDFDGEDAVHHTEAPAKTNQIPATKTEPKAETKKASPTGEKTPTTVRTTSFVPEVTMKKAGEKEGKVWLRWSIKSPIGWLGTFDEKVGELAEDAKEKKYSIDCEYKESGDFKNIVSAKASEEVPF